MIPPRLSVGLQRRPPQQKHTLFGYISETNQAHIFKRKGFARWQAGEQLPDAALCKAVKEMECGLVDANLGSFLYKKRIARPGNRYVFLCGFLATALEAGVLFEVHCEQDH